VRLEKGFKIPADVVILESNGIKVDNSSLTGESELQKRGPVMTDEAPHRTRSVARSVHLLFSPSLISPSPLSPSSFPSATWPSSVPIAQRGSAEESLSAPATKQRLV
jgi:magnesium-transporting ATPase (P-type)